MSRIVLSCCIKQLCCICRCRYIGWAEWVGSCVYFVVELWRQIEWRAVRCRKSHRKVLRGSSGACKLCHWQYFELVYSQCHTLAVARLILLFCGFVADLKLSLSAHAAALSHRGFYHLHQLYPVLRSLTHEAARTLVEALYQVTWTIVTHCCVACLTAFSG